MEKILKNIHWAIIAVALFNIVMYVMDSDGKLKAQAEQEQIQKQELSKIRKTKKEIASFYKDIDEAKGRIERVAAEIEKTQQLLPSEISDNENMNLIRKIADDINIKELTIAPEMDVDKGFYVSRKYKIKTKATYLQFLVMLETIAENKRILNVSDLDLKKIEEPQRSKFQLINAEFSLEAYHYNSAFKEDRGIDTIEKQFKADHVVAKKVRSVKKKAEE